MSEEYPSKPMVWEEFKTVAHGVYCHKEDGKTVCDTTVAKRESTCISTNEFGEPMMICQPKNVASATQTATQNIVDTQK